MLIVIALPRRCPKAQKQNQPSGEGWAYVDVSTVGLLIFSGDSSSLRVRFPGRPSSDRPKSLQGGI